MNLSGDLPARLPPLDHHGLQLGLPEVHPWRAGFSHRFPQLLRAHHHVHVLPDSCPGPQIPEVPLVEKVHDLDPTGGYSKVLGLR